MALVAGGTRGLGFLIARELADAGYAVTLTGRDDAEVASAVEQLRAAGDVRGAVCDVRDRDAVRQLVDGLERDAGPIEVAITVAGVIAVQPAEVTTLDDFELAIDTMLWGPIHVTWAVLPHQRRRGRGRLGVVASIGGKIPAPHLLAYATAKHGAVGFAEGLAVELAGSGVTMTAIVPGLMRTGAHERASLGGRAEAEYAWFGPAASLPLLAMDAERAARRSVDAVLQGRRVLVLTPLARLAMTSHGLAPSLTIRLIQAVNRVLPDAPPDRRPLVPGHVVERGDRRRLVELLTTFGRRAARRFQRASAHRRDEAG